MWKPMFNVIVAFPTEESQAAIARRALRWGCMHVHDKPFVAPFRGSEYEVRTYQFASEPLRQRFKERIAVALHGGSVDVVVEDEAARKWMPDPGPRIPGL